MISVPSARWSLKPLNMYYFGVITVELYGTKAKIIQNRTHIMVRFSDSQISLCISDSADMNILILSIWQLSNIYACRRKAMVFSPLAAIEKHFYHIRKGIQHNTEKWQNWSAQCKMDITAPFGDRVIARWVGTKHFLSMSFLSKSSSPLRH